MQNYNPYNQQGTGQGMGNIPPDQAMAMATEASQQAALLSSYGELTSKQEMARPDLIKWILEGKDVLENLRHKLHGDIEEEKGKWVHHKERQIINDLGINEIMSFLEMIVTKESTTTILSEEDILLTVRMLGHGFNRLIGYNQKKYGISTDKIELIVLAILHCIKVALMRSKDGKMLQMIQTIERRQETYIERPEEKKRSLFGLFGRR